MSVTFEKIDEIGKTLIDTSIPICERYRALFTLQNLKQRRSAEWIMKILCDESELLAHEAAYCLGQMQEPSCVDSLKSILEDESFPTIVRHEAGEALGAIAELSYLDVLKKYQYNQISEIAETCQLAVRRIEYHTNNTDEVVTINNLATIDPAPIMNNKSIEELTNIFLDDSMDIFSRYRAMFTLRNLKGDECVDVLVKGLNCGSPLFRHEVAFVLGQIQHEHAINGLIEALKDENQHPMVRHECAIALGAISTISSQDCLKFYSTHHNRLVAESCLVALDMLNSNLSGEFQYANKLLD